MKPKPKTLNEMKELAKTIRPVAVWDNLQGSKNAEDNRKDVLGQLGVA